MEDMQFEVITDGPDKLVEIPFEVPLRGIEVNTTLHLPEWPGTPLRGGHPRCLLRSHRPRRPQDAQHMVVDHKTTSIAGDQHPIISP
jgi:hypothetical protein